MEYTTLGKTGLRISRMGFGGIPIQKVGRNVQENVRKSVESMTGLHVVKVDLHVVGVSFEKENQELQQSQKLAALAHADEEHPAIEEASTPVEAIEEPEIAENDETETEPDGETIDAAEEITEEEAAAEEAQDEEPEADGE